MEQSNSWQEFHGTELGSVLQGLYGNKPKINYPKPKQKKNAFDPSKQKFQPVNSKVVEGATNPKKSTRRDIAGRVSIPRGFNGGYERQGFHAIEVIPHRRAGAEIKQEMDIATERYKAFRPAPSRRLVDESEKERFIQVCTYKGGKGLMEGVVPEAQIAPFELAAMKRQKDLENRFRSTRKGLSARPNPHQNVPQVKSKLSEKEQLAEQIQQEIDERCNYLEEMKAMDALSKKDTAQVQDEIKARTRELIALGL